MLITLDETAQKQFYIALEILQWQIKKTQSEEIAFYSDGKNDDTHLSLLRATAVAELAVKQIKISDNILLKKLKSVRKNKVKN